MVIEKNVIDDGWHGYDGIGGANREYRKEILLSETEKGEKAKTLNGYKEKCVFKIICNINVPFRKVFLRNGCHSITYLDLIFLEVLHNQSQLTKIRDDDVNFCSGWLHDEIINSYLFQIQFQFKHVIYCGSTEVLLIYNGESFRKMWKRKSLSEKQFLFIPFNLSNRHWTLLFVNLKTKTMYILDPLKQYTDADLVNKAAIVTNIILANKFGYSKGCRIGSMSHFLQKDAVSRAVLSCYYASQIVKGNA